MLGKIVQSLSSAFAEHPWVPELAGILPLSALLDFIDIPTKLHIFQLIGAVPLWSWPITPSGSRILLSSGFQADDNAHLDRFGNSLALTALDGRYGDHYLISSPETLRLCLDSHQANIVENLHRNMEEKHLRIQRLEVVHVIRNSKRQRLPSKSWVYRIFLDSWWMFSPRHLTVSVAGWLAWVGMVIVCGILECHLSLAFAFLILTTGFVVFTLHGRKSLHLLVSKPSSFNRLVLVAEHTNASSWTAFYGESTLVNSLLNRPLEPIGPDISATMARMARIALGLCIGGQWALILGAAALKGLDAYVITFWVVFCILTHALLIPPLAAVREWLRSCACIELRRYQAQLSSRRALLNTVMALNPDTFSQSEATKQDDRSSFYKDALKWIDPILAQGSSRTRWENATRDAMNGTARYTSDELTSMAWRGTSGDLVSPEWDRTYHPDGGDYWRPFILEGIYMAERIKRSARLPGRIVSASPVQRA